MATQIDLARDSILAYLCTQGLFQHSADTIRNDLQISGDMFDTSLKLLESGGLITISPDLYSPNNRWIKLTPEGHAWISGGKSYKEVRNQESLAQRQREADLEIAENIVRDYPQTKKDAKISKIIAIIAIVASALTLLWQILHDTIFSSK